MSRSLVAGNDGGWCWYGDFRGLGGNSMGGCFVMRKLGNGGGLGWGALSLVDGVVGGFNDPVDVLDDGGAVLGCSEDGAGHGSHGECERRTHVE